MFIRIAWLSLMKHWKRTLLIIFAVMISVAVMEIVAGMFNGMRVNFFRNLTQQGGHVQIHGKGWEDRLNPYSLDIVISDYEKVVEEVRRMEGSSAAEPLLQFGALLQADEGLDVEIGGFGVLPDTQFFSNVRDGMQEGGFPRGAAVREKAGEETGEETGDSSDDSDGIVISRAIADLLEIELDSAVQVVVEDSTGSPFYYQYTVTGIFRTNSQEFDENTFFITHNSAQNLLYLPGRTTEIRVRLEDSSLAEQFKSRLLRETESAASLSVQTWRDLNSGVTVMLEMMDFFIFFMDLFVVIVAASVITNAILMNVFERIREFGTLRAIGLKKRQLTGMIMTEGAVQGIAGGLLGLLIGIPFVIYFSRVGLDWGGISEAFGLGSDLFYFGYSVRNSVINLGSGILIALAGSLYAAGRGAKLSIMDSLHYV